MKFGVYSIADALTGYMRPTVEQNDAVAMRNFRAAILQVRDGNVLHCDPQDFTLYKIGTFETDSGELSGHAPVPVVTGMSVMLDSLNKEDNHGV